MLNDGLSTISLKQDEQSETDHMKVAVIGRGKTGSSVAETLNDENIDAVYHRDNPPTATKLQKADVAIVFVNADGLEAVMPELIQARIPVVCGTTGYGFSDKLAREIAEQNNYWVVASNFSLAMALIRQCCQILAQGENLLTNPGYHIHEIHHKQKLDAPSGTALRWRDWLGLPETPVTYERINDVFGQHSLTVDSELETIQLQHQAKSRALFAQGAIWAAREILLCKRKRLDRLKPGLNDFHQLIKNKLGTN